MKMKNSEKEEIFKIREMKEPLSEVASSSSRQPIKKRRRGRGLFTFLLLIAVIALSYGYYTKDRELKILQNPQAKAAMDQKEINRVVAQVSKLIILPKDESPQVLTINDAAAAIKQQPVFAGSVNGDKVLIYQKAARAIVYSPSRNIIVTILPVTVDSTTSANSTSNGGTTSSSNAKKASTSSSSESVKSN